MTVQQGRHGEGLAADLARVRPLSRVHLLQMILKRDVFMVIQLLSSCYPEKRCAYDYSNTSSSNSLLKCHQHIYIEIQ